MKELTVISGKGGTGKTSLAASFAMLSGMLGGAVMVDGDVDASDLHLLLKPVILERHEFRSGWQAVIQEKDCVRCGGCLAHCRFEAIRMNGATAGEASFQVDPSACEGCGVCVDHCPVRAMDLVERICGEWFVSNTRFGPMVHARLGAAAENSGKLVSVVREMARNVALAQNRRLIIIDGPPGIGCPVIASIARSDMVLIVTEPTLSGEHDLKRVMELVRRFEIPMAVAINKWDINPAMTEKIERQASSSVRFSARIPCDPMVTRAQVNGQTAMEFSPGPASESIEQIWKNLCQTIKP
ncbi:MAG: ATP-binding protein [Verrucomicrobiae bacterium]|nr:ATP-binding protein [Verrucomicrobiae bacterium]